MTIGVLLSGCGVFDGSEIHESICTLLALEENNLKYICIAPDINQHHVVNHISGDEIQESRNVLIESSRIARGDIKSLDNFNYDNIDGIVIPGGFGAAKNLSNWAFKGTESKVDKDVQGIIQHCFESQKPIVGLCISPTVIAKSLQVFDATPQLTIGSVHEDSEYNIKEMQDAISTLGVKVVDTSIKNICIDKKNKIITAPCYMMKASPLQVYMNTKEAINTLKEMLD
ncbi:MAG: isoprenoid biosynthesis glyoxalase ElbB [Bacteroidota bacterium]|nr:isoprenoid biosynthesis glyoxalase ElbB [Bacteroidota bacterium]